MNIYLLVEISARELVSKLLLGTLAAARGHNVIISSIGAIKGGLRRGVLPPGIFLDKCLTPTLESFATHKEMVNNNILISSLDEESGILDHGYENFAKNRYSNELVEQSTAIFGWGDEDVDSLKQIYPKYSSKIYKTGSPRVDLWKSQFSKNWILPSSAPSRPYLLISSNLHTANFAKPFYEWGGFFPYQLKENISYYKNNPESFKKQFSKLSEDNLKLASFVEAIHFLANSKNDYDIILRPHPLENIDTWKVYLRGVPNVHVIRDGNISPWVNHAFAIMHNSCTTAIEATVSGKEVITYIPFVQNNSWGEVANELGHCTKTLEELSNKVDLLFNKFKSGNENNENKKLPDTLLKKIYIDKNELAADKIIAVWEKLAKENLLQNSSLSNFRLFLKIAKIKDFFLSMGKKVFSGKKTNLNENEKFPSLDIKKIHETIETFQNGLKIKENLDCKLLNDRTILIKKK